MATRRKKNEANSRITHEDFITTVLIIFLILIFTVGILHITNPRITSEKPKELSCLM